MAATVTTYPNGWTLSSSAISQQDFSKFVQTQTCGMLGIVPPDYSQVRVVWPTQGQPFSTTPQQDVCYVSCVLEDDNYTKVRDLSTDTLAAQAWVYTRAWRVGWVLYGPNSLANATKLWTATFLDYFANQFETLQMYFVNEPPQPVRAPEEFNAEWWERADFHIMLYEQVNETLTPPNGAGLVTSVEVKLNDGSAQDPVADFTVIKE